MAKPKIGLVLGSGAARGWAHVGVIRELESMGIRPDLVVGTSAGSLVGGAYVSGNLERFAARFSSLGRRDLIRLIDFHPNSGGFLKGSRVIEAIESVIGNPLIENLQIPFACVTTSLLDGKEHWIHAGSLLDAVHASIAIPGIFAPVIYNPNVFVDGGLVNPIPVSLARAMGADLIIAVNLNVFVEHQNNTAPTYTRIEKLERSTEQMSNAIIDEWSAKLKSDLNMWQSFIFSLHNGEKPAETSLFEVIVGSIHIMQNGIVTSHMSKDKPDIEIRPKLSHVRFMEFDRAKEIISEGHRATRFMASNLANLRDQKG